MSKLLLTFTEQELHKKMKSDRHRLLHDLTLSVKHQRVKFHWSGRQRKDHLHKLDGTVIKGGLDYNDDITLVIKFMNPETEAEESVVRYISELIE
jgi:hypothetical protein|tara:strand:+ start:799 stop:1083 length:285 start_codon:yes stop_codon:yes gene_type:complete